MTIGARDDGSNGEGRSLRRREAGVALIAAMMVLAMVVTLAIAALEATTRDQQVAGVQMRARVAFQAAEAGLATALSTMAGSATPTLVAANIGITGDYPIGLPGYRLDPSVPTPVEYLGSQPVPGMSLNINGSGPTYQLEIWRFHVEGDEPRGMISRVEAAAAAFWGS